MEGSLLTHLANLAGDDVSTLQREISQIKELLEAEPDSKCKPAFPFLHFSCKASLIQLLRVYRASGVSGALFPIAAASRFPLVPAGLAGLYGYAKMAARSGAY